MAKATKRVTRKSGKTVTTLAQAVHAYGVGAGSAKRSGSATINSMIGSGGPLSLLRPPQHRAHALRIVGCPILVELPSLCQLRRFSPQRQTASAQPFGQLHGRRRRLA
jgi:hypothetical protein